MLPVCNTSVFSSSCCVFGTTGEREHPTTHRSESRANVTSRTVGGLWSWPRGAGLWWKDPHWLCKVKLNLSHLICSLVRTAPFNVSSTLFWSVDMEVHGPSQFPTRSADLCGITSLPISKQSKLPAVTSFVVGFCNQRCVCSHTSEQTLLLSVPV